MQKLRSFYQFTARCLTTTICLGIAAEFLCKFNLDNLPFAARFVLGSLGAVCALVFFPFWLGMMCDALFTSKRPIYVRLLWFIFIALTVWVGPLVYYYAAFDRRTSKKSHTGKTLGDPAPTPAPP
jgi:hypothetical protein